MERLISSTEKLAQTALRAGRGIHRRIGWVAPDQFRDLPTDWVTTMAPVLRPQAVEHNMIIAKNTMIGKHTDEARRSRHPNTAFFLKFTAQRKIGSFSALDTAAGKE